MSARGKKRGGHKSKALSDRVVICLDRDDGRPLFMDVPGDIVPPELWALAKRQRDRRRRRGGAR